MAATGTQMKREFGQRLRDVRKACGYETARAFADVIEVDQNTYTMWERGERYPENITDLKRIKDVTGATIDYLYFGDREGLPIRLHHQINRQPQDRIIVR